MEKAIRVTAILALVIQVAYIAFGRFMLPLIAASATPYVTFNMDGQLVYLAYTFGSSFVYLTAFVLFMVLLLFAAKNRGEKIGMEIACIVVTTVVIPLLNSAVAWFERLYLATMRSEIYATVNVMNTYESFLSMLNMVSMILLVISCTISICRKKFVIPLEYDKGYGVNDEYNSREFDEMGMFS